MTETTDAPIGLGNDDSQFAAGYSFPLDGFQLEAIDALRDGRSVLVTAPTGTGKTVVAEYGLFHARRAGKRAVYTAPIKAVSNQKYREFSSLYPGEVGLLTGDIVENRNAPILVMTTEVARNMLVQEPDSFADVGVLIFDEIHYLADRERGTTWEEAIVFCPPTIPIVCLSATLANAGEFVAWLRYAHGDTTLVQYNRRPVPLEYLYYTRRGRLELTLDAQGRIVKSFKGHGGENLLIQQRAAYENGHHKRHHRLIDEDAPSKLAKALAEAEMLPAIYFLFSRRDVEDKAMECAEESSLFSPEESAAAVSAFDGYLADWDEEDRSLWQVRSMRDLIQRGIAYHHAGILPSLKVVVERLFNEGAIKLVFATDTLALGINMPARSVVIGALNKYDGHVRRPLLSNEIRQMGGRAGRRGIDARGYVVLPWSPWSTWSEATAIARGPLEPIKSSFSLRYNAVLNLLSDGDSVRLDRLIERSLLAFQSDSHLEALRRRREQLLEKILAAPVACDRGAGEEELTQYVAAQNWLDRVNKTIAELERQLSGEESAPKKHKERVRALNQLKSERRLRGILQRNMGRFRCSFCPLDDEHLPVLKRQDETRVALTKIEEQMTRRDRQVRANTQQYLRHMLDVLKQFGYLDTSGLLTAKADRLRNVFDENCLIIAEMVDGGVLEGLSPAQIAEVFSWFAFDRDTTNIYSQFRQPAILHGVREEIDAIAARVLRVEQKHKVVISRPVDKGLPGVAQQWAEGATFSHLLDNIKGVSEGDIVLTLNKTLDLMRQVRDMLDKTGGRDGLLRANIAQAERLIRRGVVAQCTLMYFNGGEMLVDDGDSIPDDTRLTNYDAAEEPQRAQMAKDDVIQPSDG